MNRQRPSLAELGYESYSAYLRSDQWADVKGRFRASNLAQTCRVCGEATVDLHHRTYRRVGRERLDDLIPLCRKHHEEVHNKQRAAPQPAKLEKVTKRYVGRAKHATPKQVAWIKRLGGDPELPITRKEAKRLTSRLQAARAQQRKHQERGETCG